MPRQIQIVSPPERSGSLLTRLQEMGGVIGTRLQKGASQQPPGDVISIDVLNSGMPEVCRLLADEGVGADGSSSFSTSEPRSLVQSSAAEAIARDTSEMSWEEIELAIGHQSNMTINAMIVMFISGVIATIGIATNALHIVLGAMLIAPGFLPMVRVSLGIVAENDAWRRGLIDIFKGYAALAAGAACATLLLIALDKPPLGEEASYLPAGTLISYWTSVTGPSVAVSVVSGVVGTILLATGRSVLTAGVMVALALVPGAALIGMGAVAGDLDTIAGGALRWAVDVAMVMLTSLAVLFWKRRAVHKRPMMP
ncbi:MAG TPA: DUF389 domain-containing protein [Allosphingosinicella sp.]|nr:DUF389 domain-containing protein [Allosphingosinicella sp.]